MKFSKPNEKESCLKTKITQKIADKFLDLVKGASAGILFEIHFLGIHKLFVKN